MEGGSSPLLDLYSMFVVGGRLRALRIVFLKLQVQVRVVVRSKDKDRTVFSL